MPKMHRVDCMAEADLKVYVTDVRMDADLIVFETSDVWAAEEPEIWFYTDVQGEADWVVCLVSSRWDADLIIYRTDIQPDAGWVDQAKADLL
jgi:hypothetical protein